MTARPKRNPAEVWPVATFLTEEMEARRWSPATTAAECGLSLGRVAAILEGQPLTDDDAARLGIGFGTSAAYWRSLDTAFWAGLARLLGPGEVDWQPPTEERVDVIMALAEDFRAANKAQYRETRVALRDFLVEMVTNLTTALAAVIPPGAVVSSAEREAAIARLTDRVARSVHSQHKDEQDLNAIYPGGTS